MPGYLPGWGYPAWQDEFDYRDAGGNPAVDPANWNIRDSSTFGNTFDTANISAAQITVDEQGILHIKGKWRDSPVVTSYGAAGNPTERWVDTGYMDQRIIKAGDVQPYTQQYGRWEMRAKVASGPNQFGTDCGFWLRNQQGRLGEIDIMESWGFHEVGEYGQFPGTNTLTIHSNTNGPGSTNPTYQKIFWRPQTELHMGGGSRSLPTPPVYEDFHVFGFEYTPSYLSGDFDGEVYIRTTPADHPWLWQDASFGAPFHVRINMHVGCSIQYWGLPDPSHQDWTANLDYQIDYVRIYAIPTGGLGDANVTPPSCTGHTEANTYGSSITVPYTSTAGSTLLAAVQGAADFTVTDDAGNTWTALTDTASLGASSQSLGQLFAATAADPVTSITVTRAGSANINVAVTEWTPSTVPASAAGLQGTADATVATQNGDTVYSAGLSYNGSGTTQGAPAGYTAIATAVRGTFVADEAYNSAPASSETPAWTRSGTGILAAVLRPEAPNTGAASGGIAWTGHAAGTAPTIAEHTGHATGTIQWDSTATGARDSTGTGTTAVTWAAAATGETPSIAEHSGTAATTITWVAQAAGHATTDRIDITVAAAVTRLRALAAAQPTRNTAPTAAASRTDWTAAGTRTQRGT